MMKYKRWVALGWMGLLLQACGGGGGGSSIGPVGTGGSTPLPVFASSFENKGISTLTSSLVPKLSLIVDAAQLNGRDSVPESLAVADFQRSGSYSAFVVASSPTVDPTADKGRVFFLSQSGTVWTDISSRLFVSNSDREACARPQQALVSDLNGDGKPDVYLACAAAALVSQYLYLSRADGAYEMRRTSDMASHIRLDAMGAAIGFVDGDSIPDIVSTDNGSLVVMLGEVSAGQYTLKAHEPGRLPVIPAAPSGARSVFLLPRTTLTPGSAITTTRHDLLVGGNGTQGSPVAWYRNNSGYFNPTDALKVRQYAAVAGDANNRYDYVENDRYGYLYVTDSSSNDVVRMWRIEKPDDSGTSTSLAQHSPDTAPAGDWPARVRLAGSYLVPFDAGCPLTVTLDNASRCGKRYPVSVFGP